MVKKSSVMNKKYSKRQLYSGMAGKLERIANRDYERKIKIYNKKKQTIDKMLKDLEKPTKAKVRKELRSLRQKRMRY